jgi:hypothetical protein
LLLLLLLLPFWSDGLRVLVVVWTTGRLIHDWRTRDRVSIDHNDSRESVSLSILPDTHLADAASIKP